MAGFGTYQMTNSSQSFIGTLQDPELDYINACLARGVAPKLQPASCYAAEFPDFVDYSLPPHPMSAVLQPVAPVSYQQTLGGSTYGDVLQPVNVAGTMPRMPFQAIQTYGGPHNGHQHHQPGQYLQGALAQPIAPAGHPGVIAGQTFGDAAQMQAPAAVTAQRTTTPDAPRATRSETRGSRLKMPNTVYDVYRKWFKKVSQIMNRAMNNEIQNPAKYFGLIDQKKAELRETSLPAVLTQYGVTIEKLLAASDKTYAVKLAAFNGGEVLPSKKPRKGKASVDDQQQQTEQNTPAVANAPQADVPAEETVPALTKDEESSPEPAPQVNDPDAWTAGYQHLGSSVPATGSAFEEPKLEVNPFDAGWDKLVEDVQSTDLHFS